MTGRFFFAPAAIFSMAVATVAAAHGSSYADSVFARVHSGGRDKDALFISRRPVFVGSECRGNFVRLARDSRDSIDTAASAVIGVGARHPRVMEFHKGRMVPNMLGNFVT